MRWCLRFSGHAAEPAPIFWVSRGSYARRAGAQPRWLPGIRVALDQYQELDAPVTLAEIRSHKDALLALRERIRAEAGGQPIYFPWIPYRDTLRTFQSYLVKMPPEAIGLFPQLRLMVETAMPGSLSFLPAGSGEQAQEAVEAAAGNLARRARGQGFQLDQEAKVAVEAHAIYTATDFYRRGGWDVQDVHVSESYDLVCRNGDEVKHVEVKGTTTDGAEVILTPNEVRHAQDYRYVALFVLSAVAVDRDDSGRVTASGGVRHLYDPWNLHDGTLTALGFRYQVPVQRPAAV